MHPLIVDDHPLFRDAPASAIRLAYPDPVLHEAARIAYELGVGDSTVKAHVSEILRKLDVISRTRIVIETALLDFDQIQIAPAG